MIIYSENELLGESGGREQRGIALISRSSCLPWKNVGRSLLWYKKILKIMEFVNYRMLFLCSWSSKPAVSKFLAFISEEMERSSKIPSYWRGFPAQYWCTWPLNYGTRWDQAVGWHPVPWASLCCPLPDKKSAQPHCLFLLCWGERALHQWANTYIFTATALFLKKRSLRLFCLALKVFHKKQDTQWVDGKLVLWNNITKGDIKPFSWKLNGTLMGPSLLLLLL